MKEKTQRNEKKITKKNPKNYANTNRNITEGKFHTQTNKEMEEKKHVE